MGPTSGSTQSVSSKPKTSIGRVVLIVGVLPVIIFYIWYAHVHWTVADKPVSLSPGMVKFEFTPNFDGRYVAGIRAQRTLPFESLQCLLGEKDYSPAGQCKEIPSVLQFNWRLMSNDSVVASGTSDHLAGDYTGSYIEMEFLNFRAKPGQRFNLELDFPKDGSTLAVTRPHLIVRVDSWDSVDTAMLFPWLLVLAVASAIIGVALQFGIEKKQSDE